MPVPCPSVPELLPGSYTSFYSSSSSTSGTESRGAGEDGRTSVGSDEENNWGMDDSIDVNAVREMRGLISRKERMDTRTYPRSARCA